MAAKYDKLIDEIGNLSVFELNELVKALEDKLGVSAAMPIMSASPAAAGQSAAQEGAGAKQEEQAAYKVTLESIDEAKKLQVIKALRQFRQDLNLTAAKEVVEKAPTVISESAPKADALKMKEELEKAGAKVTLS